LDTPSYIYLGGSLTVYSDYDKELVIVTDRPSKLRLLANPRYATSEGYAFKCSWNGWECGI